MKFKKYYKKQMNNSKIIKANCNILIANIFIFFYKLFNKNERYYLYKHKKNDYDIILKK